MPIPAPAVKSVFNLWDSRVPASACISFTPLSSISLVNKVEVPLNKPTWSCKF